MQLTLTHIRLCDANDAKVAALDALAAEYMALCQQYVTHFCAEAEPDGYADPCFPSPLSQRWQRVAIQQAAGIAKSWRSNLQRAQEEFADTLAAWLEEEHPPDEDTAGVDSLADAHAQEDGDPGQRQCRALAAQSGHVVCLLAARLHLGSAPADLPPRQTRGLSPALSGGQAAGQQRDAHPQADGWWLTLTYEEEVPLQTPPDAPVVGVDVGITHFLTTSTGKHYGSFQGKLAKRHQRDRRSAAARPSCAHA